MAENTKIEWTDATWNPMAGCSIVSPGCHKCYAMRTAYRLEAMGQEKYQGTTEKENGRILWTGKINLDEKALSIPLKKKKPTTWFVNSMSDLFHEDVPFEFVDKVFAVMALCPQHTFQVLTKRPERMAEYLSTAMCRIAGVLDSEFKLGPFPNGIVWPKRNIWLGTSVEDQQRADERIPHLLRCPATVRFLSCEPLLGPIDLLLSAPELDDIGCGIDWVIAGGESGPGARRCDIENIRFIVRQCRDASVPCFVKQVGSNSFMGVKGFGPTIKHPKGGEISEWPEDIRVREMPHVAVGVQEWMNFKPGASE